MMRYAKLVLIYAMIGFWSAHAWAQGTDSTEWFIGPVGVYGDHATPRRRVGLES